MAWTDYYADLNLNLGATANDVQAAYKDLELTTNPKYTGNPNRTAFDRVKRAYKKLSNDDFRTAYNRTYWMNKLQHDPVGYESYTRTKVFEEEENEQ